MLYRIVISFSILLCAGCTYHRTANELRTETSTSSSFCTTKPADEVQQILYENMYNCYHRVDEDIQVSATVQTKVFDNVIEKQNDNAKKSVTWMTRGIDGESFVVVLDVTSPNTSECPTKVEMFVFNSMWKRRFKEFEGWVSNPGEDSC